LGLYWQLLFCIFGDHFLYF